MTVQVERHMFTVDEYHRMGAAGILDEDDRVELIEGDIIQMAPIGSSHAGCVEKLNWLFSQSLDLQRVIVRVQDPIAVSPETEPQPDIVLVPFREDFYRLGHPSPSEVLLLIEVAESSLSFDREVKALLYSRAGVREFWLVDVMNQAIEVFRGPSSGGYQRSEVVRRGGSVSPTALPSISLTLDEILG